MASGHHGDDRYIPALCRAAVDRLAKQPPNAVGARVLCPCHISRSRCRIEARSVSLIERKSWMRSFVSAASLFDAGPAALPLPPSLAWSPHWVEGFLVSPLVFRSAVEEHTLVWRAARETEALPSLRGGQVAAALLCIVTAPAVTVRANPPAAVERPWRSPQ